MLSAAVALWTEDDDRVSRTRIYLGAVSSQPVAATRAAEVLVGHPLSEERIAEAARLARKAATPMDNTDFLTQWRGVMVERYTEAALLEAAGLPQRLLPPPH